MAANAIFETVPEKDSFRLYKNGIPQVSVIKDIMGLTKAQIAESVEIQVTLLRSDAKMSKKVRDRMTEYAHIIDLVGNHFNQDLDKTIRWFKLPNPALGGISPKEMILLGRYKKLMQFIMSE